MRRTERKVVAYKQYFLDFYQTQSQDVQRKIEWTLKLIQVTQQVPEKYFKHIEGTKGLFEVRVEVGSNIYWAPINCFFFVKLQFKNPHRPMSAAVLKFRSPQKI